MRDCFHTFMYLHGLMNGKGLKSILEMLYGENVLLPMLNGKAFRSVFRGQFLVNNFLHQLVMQFNLNVNSEFTLLINETEDMYSCILREEPTLQTVVKSSAISRICEVLDKEKSEVRAQSKASKDMSKY